MRTTIELPQVGESVTEGVIGKWLVEPGQRVEKYDALVEVVTDKVSMEAPSPYAGVFVRALVEEGETVPMGDPICEMEIDAAEPAEPARRPSPIGSEEGEPSPRPSPYGRGSDEEEGDEAAAPQEAEAVEQSESVAADAESGAEEQGESVAADAESGAEEQGESVAADAESDAEEQGESVAADAESGAEDEDDGAGKVGGAWAMPAAQNEQVGGDSEDAEQDAAGDADSTPQEEGAAQAGADAAPQEEGVAAGDMVDSAPQEEDAAAGDAEKPASEHPFEFVGSVRSVGPTGSGERGEGRPDAAQDAAIAAATEPVAQEEVAAAATEPVAQEEVAAAAAEPVAQEEIAAPATEPVAQEEVAAPATEPVAQEEVAAAATEPVAQEEVAAAAAEPVTQEVAVAAATEPAPQETSVADATEPVAQEEVAAAATEPAAEPVAQDAAVATATAPAPPRAAAEPDRRHVVSPLVARLSAQYGIDLSTVRGTGTGGRVTSQDLLNAVSAAEARRAAEEAAASEEAESVAAAATPSPIGSEEGVPSPQPSPIGRGSAEADEGAAPQEAEAVDVPSPQPSPIGRGSDEADEGAAPQEAGAVDVPSPQPSPIGRGSDEADEGAAPQEAEGAAPQEAEALAPDAPPQEDGASPQEEGAAPQEAESVAPGVPPQEDGAATVAAAAEEAESAAPVAPPQEDEAAAPAAEAAERADDGVSLLPVTPIRRAIAEHMARSASEIPAAWAMVEADATGLVRARDARKEAFEREREIPLTYLPFLANAAAQALRERPKLNARWDDGRIILNNRVNLSVAVATEAGLMVPVLRDADTLSVEETAVALRRLTEAARNGALTLDDVQGGTFTLNNTGALGSVVSVPIINHPQAAILTTEAIVKRPVVIHGDAIAARSMMNLCISFDHRVCDGADAAGFLRAVKDRLEALDESAALG